MDFLLKIYENDYIPCGKFLQMEGEELKFERLWIA